MLARTGRVGEKGGGGESRETHPAGPSPRLLDGKSREDGKKVQPVMSHPAESFTVCARTQTVAAASSVLFLHQPAPDRGRRGREPRSEPGRRAESS